MVVWLTLIIEPLIADKSRNRTRANIHALYVLFSPTSISTPTPAKTFLSLELRLPGSIMVGLFFVVGSSDLGASMSVFICIYVNCINMRSFSLSLFQA